MRFETRIPSQRKRMASGFRISKEHVKNLLKARDLRPDILAALPKADAVRVLMNAGVSETDIGKVLIYLSTEYERQDHSEFSDEATSLVEKSLQEPLITSQNNKSPVITAFPLHHGRKTHRDATSMNLQPIPEDTYTYTEVSKLYTGITNSGSTCYLNSTIQVLYHIPLFRKLIYSIDITTIECSESTKIVLALQSLFFALEKKESFVSTAELTEAFGWTNSAKFVQHDTHEMIQKLFESLEVITKGTDVGMSINENFYGEMLVYVQCLDVEHRTSRCEKFLDLQVVVSGCSSLNESLDLLVKRDQLDGKYLLEHPDGTTTRHPAEMGSCFSKIPSVLFVHPSRAFFCNQRFERVTFDNEWTFPVRINLNAYLHSSNTHTANSTVNGDSASNLEDMEYELRSVVIHSGTALAGHYYCYVNFEGKWVCFNDTIVSDVDEETVMREAFSTPSRSIDYWGSPVTKPSYKRATLLTYVRVSAKNITMSEVSGNEISILKCNLALEKERRRAYEEEKKRLENLISVRVLIEDTDGLFLTYFLSAHQNCEKLVDIKIDKRECFIKSLKASLVTHHYIEETEIENIWMYEANGVVMRAPYYAAKFVDENTSYSGRGIIFVQCSRNRSPLQKGTERQIPLIKTDYQRQDVEKPQLIHMSLLLSKEGTIEFKKSFCSLIDMMSCLDALTVDDESRDLSVETAALNYDCSYGSSLMASEVIASEGGWNYFVVSEKEILEVSPQDILSGEVVIVTPRSISQEDVTYAYDRVYNLVTFTVYLLDNTETPLEIGVGTMAQSVPFKEVQEVIFNMISDSKRNGSLPTWSPLPLDSEFIGLRCHDHNFDKPHQKLCNSFNTLKGLLSNNSHYMTGKLYIQVLPVPLFELENSKCVSVLCRVSYDFCRYVYIPYKNTVLYGEVLQFAMNQLYPLMPPCLYDYVQRRMSSHNQFRSEGKKEFTPGYDPVFRLIESKCKSIVSWEYPIAFSAYTTYTIDMLPPNYSDLFMPHVTDGDALVSSHAEACGSAQWDDRSPYMLKSLSHADRRSGEYTLYDVETLLLVPKDLSNITGSEVMDLVAKHYRFHPSMIEKQSVADNRVSFYETAMKKWRLAFKGPQGTKLLGMDERFSSIESDIGGTVEMILLDHPDKSFVKLKGSGRSAEQEIRINIVSKALNDPVQRNPLEAKK